MSQSDSRFRPFHMGISDSPNEQRPKSPGQILYEAWRDAPGSNAEEKWTALAEELQR